jgi:hypothetical protein
MIIFSTARGVFSTPPDFETVGLTPGETRAVPGVIGYFDFSGPDGNSLSCYSEPGESVTAR